MPIGIGSAVPPIFSSLKLQNRMDKKVYLIRAAQFYKIGISADIDKRLKQIQTGCPIKCEYIGYFPTRDPEELERTLHKACRDHHTHGEWFYLGDDMIQRLITEYMLKYVVNPYEPMSSDLATVESSVALQRQRELSDAVAVATRIYEGLFSGKTLTDTGKDTVRKLIDKYGPDTVFECMRHSRDKAQDSQKFWDLLPKNCRNYDSYGRHVPDMVWAYYMKIARKFGKDVANDFLIECMDSGADINNSIHELVKLQYNG